MSGSQLQPGDTVDVSGAGFVMPEPGGCEVVLSQPDVLGRALDVPTRCSLDGRPYGAVKLESRAGEPVEVGRYEVAVCLPSCEAPWAGALSGELTVTSPWPSPSIRLPEPPDRVSPPAEASVAAPDNDRGGQAARDSRAAPSGGSTTMSRQPYLVAQTADGVRLSPDPAQPGEEVLVTARSLPALSSDCELRWDSHPAEGACQATPGGELAGTIVTPFGAAAGEHAITACRPACSDPAGGRADAPVTVVVVPEQEQPTGPGEDTTTPFTHIVPRPDTASGDEEGTGELEATPATVTTEGSRWSWFLAALVLLAGLVAVAASGRLSRADSVRSAEGPQPQVHVYPDAQPDVETELMPLRRPVPGVRLRAETPSDPLVETEVLT